jgi:hypothetical protein
MISAIIIRRVISRCTWSSWAIWQGLAAALVFLHQFVYTCSTRTEHWNAQHQTLDVGRLAVVSFDDPYEQAAWPDAHGARDVTARLRPVGHADGSFAEGQPAWEPPRKPRVTAVANLRGDVLGRMFARHQISEPQFLGGRASQTHHDASQVGSIRSVDLEKTRVSGGLLADPLTDRQKKAAARLRA